MKISASPIAVGLCLVLSVASAVGQGPTPTTAATPPVVVGMKAKPPTVIVSVAPLRGLVEPMLIDAGWAKPGDVKTLIPPGVSEHGYEIPPSTLATLSRADIVLLVGIGLEPQVEKFLKDRPRPQRRVLIAGDELGMKADAEHEHHDHDGDGECDHEHGAADPHVWLDPLLAEKLVPAIAFALIAHAGEDAAAVQSIRLAEAAMLSRVRAVHDDYRTTLAKAKTRTLVVGHDAWGHLASRYDLKTVAIKGLTATEPTPSSLAAATTAIREQGARAVFVEPQLNQRAGRRIARSTGVPVLVIDPLGDGDWVKLMQSNLAQLAKGLGVE